MPYLVHSRPQLLIIQQPERKNKTYLLIDKCQVESCTEPAPPIPNLLEQVFETTPVIPENIGEEAPLVRMMKYDVKTGSNRLLEKFRVGRLLQPEMFLEKPIESLMLKRRQFSF